MKEAVQAGKFYRGLSDKQKRDLAEAVAEDIFFLDDDLQKRIIELLDSIDHELGSNVRQCNHIRV